MLRRNFKFTTMLGFASTVLVAWEILPVISIYALENGGTAIIFWSLVSLRHVSAELCNDLRGNHVLSQAL